MTKYHWQSVVAGALGGLLVWVALAILITWAGGAR
jgi:hypothetical protein